MTEGIKELWEAFDVIADKVSTDPKKIRKAAAARSALKELIDAYIEMEAASCVI